MGVESPDQVAVYLRQCRNALSGILILSVIAVVYIARDFVLPVVIAFFLAITFRPTIRRLANYNVPPWMTATAFAGALVLAGFLAVYVASGPITDWIENAPEIERTLENKIRRIAQSLEGIITMSEKIQDAATPDNGAQVQEVVIKQDISSVLSGAALYPANFIFMLSGAVVIAVFLMASGDLFYEKIVKVLPTLTDKKTALRIVYDVEREVSAYLISTSVINAGVGTTVAVSFYALGMPNPLLWGLLAFIFNWIPYAGPIAGTLLSAVASVVVFDSIASAMLPPLAYTVFIGLETQIISPAFLSRRLRLNSVAILITIAFWAWLWGIPGIVVAVPLLVTLRVFCSHLDSLAGIGEFLTESSRSDKGKVEQIIAVDLEAPVISSQETLNARAKTSA